MTLKSFIYRILFRFTNYSSGLEHALGQFSGVHPSTINIGGSRRVYFFLGDTLRLDLFIISRITYNTTGILHGDGTGDVPDPGSLAHPWRQLDQLEDLGQKQTVQRIHALFIYSLVFLEVYNVLDSHSSIQ